MASPHKAGLSITFSKGTINMAKRKTTVDNIRNYDCNNLPSHCVLVDRTTIFGNPYPIGRYGNRDDVIVRYRRYFYNRIKDTLFREDVESLSGKTLLCWCHPLPCHADIIADYLNDIKV